MDKYIIRICCAIWVFAAVSCSGGKVMNRLCEIESFINDRPDSALAAIRSIDTLKLGTKAEKAKYSLLHAMALDKNWIDTTDTRIIMPAVEYYSKHGSPEDKLKAYMYLGVAQYNSKQYDEAIVSFSSAAEQEENVRDYNLKGVLYSKIADTYTMTFDYSNANKQIEKSIECFRVCGRRDQENLERVEKARCLINLMEWKKADDYLKDLLQDTTFSKRLIRNIEGTYAMMILYSPEHHDSLALRHFNNALKIDGTL